MTGEMTITNGHKVIETLPPRFPRLGKDKVAIVGFCSSSREATPYEDPSFEIWGLNRGYLFMRRADRWWEMHGQTIVASQERRPGKHVEWLNRFQGPVYMHEDFAEIKNCVVYPLKEIADFLGEFVYRIGVDPQPGRSASSGTANGMPLTDLDKIVDTMGEPYLSSSIAYEVALAIYEGFKEIHLYGIDLNTEAEYAWQKPGVEFLLGVAAGRGIKVVLPANCPLLKGTLYGRGFMSARGEKMSYEQLRTRLTSLEHDYKRVGEDLNRLNGARQELILLMGEMVPGMNHEKMDDRRKGYDQRIGQLSAQIQQIHGGMVETAYWLHQTMEGQQPDEAIQQIINRLEQQDLRTEGPITESETFMEAGHEVLMGSGAIPTFAGQNGG